MKKLFLIITALLFCNCSSDSINDTITQEPITEEQIKNIKYLAFMSDGNDSATIVYTNDLLDSFDDEGSKYQLEYNSSNKVSYAINQHGEEMTYTYSNNKLNQIDYGFYQDDFNYDSKGNIVSIVENANDGYDESNYVTYNSNGEILTYTTGTNGSTFTFEFDDKINPFYIIWKEFGFLIDLEDNIYDIIPLFFPNNPLKIYKDNELFLEANYTYDEKGYPISCRYTRYWSNSPSTQGTLTCQYLH